MYIRNWYSCSVLVLLLLVTVPLFSSLNVIIWKKNKLSQIGIKSNNFCSNVSFYVDLSFESIRTKISRKEMTQPILLHPHVFWFDKISDKKLQLLKISTISWFVDLYQRSDMDNFLGRSELHSRYISPNTIIVEKIKITIK